MVLRIYLGGLRDRSLVPFADCPPEHGDAGGNGQYFDDGLCLLVGLEGQTA